MAAHRIDVGLYVVAKPSLGIIEQLVGAAQDIGLDGVFMWDHLQDFFPSVIWDEEFSWLATQSASPHEWFEYQTLLGYLAAKYPNMRLGIGVTESVRRHPIVIAQALMTLAHLSPRRPILGIGSGERLGTEPYGLDLSHAVDRLEEALQIIRKAFTSEGPFDFSGRHFQLQGAVIDLKAPEGKTPEIWISAHGPRMLKLTGQFGDGWYPVLVASPDDYAARLDVIRQTAREAGRDPDAITPALHPPIIVAPTEEEASAMLDTKVVRFLGLILPDAIWQLFGLEHPLGKGFRGYIDIVPETYDRQTVDAAIAKVPRAMVESIFWGTPDQLVSKFRAFAEAGLRYLVPFDLSPAISPEAANYSMGALAQIAHALQNGA